MNHNYGALIVGAGPAGAAAAILLAQAGWSVALVEKQRFPRRKVCGECVAATNFALLDTLGVGESFSSLAGAELRRMAVYSPWGTTEANLPFLHGGPHRWGRALGRERLDSMLLERARSVGVSVWQPWTMREIDGSFGDYSCLIRSAETHQLLLLRARVLILANGSWERAPGEPDGQRACARPKLASDLFAFKANFTAADLDPHTLPVLAFPGGYGGLVIADDNVATVAGCIRRDIMTQCRRRRPGATAAAAVQGYLMESCPGLARALRHARLQGDWLSAGPIRPGVRKLVREDGAIPIGNAAGEAHPIIGEGISMALQSAWILCSELVSAQDELFGSKDEAAAMIRRYALRWRAAFRGRIQFAALVAHLAMRPSRARVILPLLTYWPGVLTWGARFAGKVDPAPGIHAAPLNH